MSIWTIARHLPERLRRNTNGGVYRPEIDGIRFFAIAFVLIWHCVERLSRAYEAYSGQSIDPAQQDQLYLFPLARVGVMLFFAVSGYILASGFLAANARGVFSYRTYLLRRVTRIEPPYLFILCFTYLFLTLTGYRPDLAQNFWEGPADLGQSLAASLVYMHGLIFNDLPRLFPGGWSLEIEVQFYLLAPLIFMAYFRLPTPSLRLWFGSAVLLVSFVVAQLVTEVLGWNGRHMFTLLPYFFYFWSGVFLAELVSSGALARVRAPALFWDWFGCIGVALFIASGVRQHVVTWDVEGWCLDAMRVLGVFGIFAGAIRGQAFRAFCSLPWISLVGGACYSFYLTHVQVMQVTIPALRGLIVTESLWETLARGFLLEAPLVLIGGLLFYALIERPFTQHGWPQSIGSGIARRFRRRPEVDLAQSKREQV